MGKLSRTLAAGLIASMLTACGGGGGGSTSSIPSTPKSTQTTKMAIKLNLNAKSGTASALRGRKYVSRATAGIGITFGVNGSVTLPNTEAAMRAPSFATPTLNAANPGQAYNATNASCTAPSSVDGSYSCTLLIALPVGYDDLQITTWDQAPNSLGPNSDGYAGTFAASANNLSTNNLVNQLILLNQTNSLNLALKGVVASVYLSLSSNSLVAGAPLGQSPNPSGLSLNVFAKDADGNIIIGSDPYVDANGTPITIHIAANPPTLPGSIVGGLAGSVTVTGATSFTSPSVQSTTLGFNGGDILSETFSSSVTGSALTIPVGGATLNFTRSINGPISVGASNPTINEFATALAGSAPMGIAVGPDRNLWFADNGAVKIGVMSTAGAMVANYASSVVSPTAICADSVGSLMYFGNSDTLYRITTAGTSTAVATLTAAATTSFITACALGPDGNMWFVDNANGRVGYVTPYGNFAVKTLLNGTASSPNGIAAGPDGKMWITDGGSGLDAIESISLDLATQNKVAVTSAYTPYGIVSAPDGHLYFTTNGTNRIGQVTVGASPSIAYLTNAAAINARGIAVGADANIWFGEFTAPYGIGRMSFNGTTPVWNSFTTGLNAASQPWNMTTGPDNNIWFTEHGTGKIGELVLP